MAAARQRSGTRGAAHGQRSGPALGGSAVARRQVDRASRQEPAPLLVRRREENRAPDRREHDRRVRRSGLVARFQVAGLRGGGGQHVRPSQAVRHRAGDDGGGDERALRQLQPRVEHGRQVAVPAVRPGSDLTRGPPLGQLPAGALSGQDGQDLPPRADEGVALSVRAVRRAPRRRRGVVVRRWKGQQREEKEEERRGRR